MGDHWSPPHNIWEVCPRGPGDSGAQGAHRSGGRGRSEAAQDRWGPGQAVGRPRQTWEDGFTTGEFLGAGHHITQGARRRRGLTSGSWPGYPDGVRTLCEPGATWVRPGVHVMSVGSYQANQLGNIVGGSGRGRGPHGPGHRAAPDPSSGILDPGVEAWLAAGPNQTAKVKR